MIIWRGFCIVDYYYNNTLESTFLHCLLLLLLLLLVLPFFLPLSLTPCCRPCSTNYFYLKRRFVWYGNLSFEYWNLSNKVLMKYILAISSSPFLLPWENFSTILYLPEVWYLFFWVILFTFTSTSFSF